MSSYNSFTSPDLTLERLQADLQQALDEWRQPMSIRSPLHSLRLYHAALRYHSGNVQGATNHVLIQALTELGIEHREHAEVLQSRFLDKGKVEQAASRLNLSRATFHRKRREAFPLLAEIVWQMERKERQAYRARLVRRLEQNTYTKLFGLSELLDSVESLLVTPESPWVIVITGIGGIGKTTLADALVRRLIDHWVFDDIGWVTARQTIFNAGGSFATFPHASLTTQALIEALTVQLLDIVPSGQRTSEETLAALVQRLKQAPHLIVIDNLETVRDLETLLPTLRQLVNPSKLLLTTRDSLAGEADLYQMVVPPLSNSDALAFVRQEAKTRNISPILAASDVELQPIFATVGGNPLALRLVTGQLRIHSLRAVLDTLLEAQGKQAEALYTFIYQRAWELLDQTARAVLLAMPLVSEQGGRFDLLAATCELTEIELSEGLERLATLNLVDVRGDLDERRYTIHSLTRAFLHQQVIRWQAAAA